MNLKTLNIYTDGGSRGNPGESALGVSIQDENGKILDEIGKTLGIATNNVAEYSAIIEGWKWLLTNKEKLSGLSKVNFFMDSNLASSQLNGIYKIKNPNLRELLFTIRQFESEWRTPVTYSHIPRERNKKADKLVNMALDGYINS